ncbi:HAD family hydrolase [Nocardiopsis changdeensis]|uniref:HAD-IA family hydrolase n=1 Tax=Nocardiopsis changdeensis TaxID=2831969 RepID=A0ABX8BEG3_9ACTN|nr:MULTISPECIES: HAD-IA family hydrolase [Nocardiopsis]QUX20644.1 HAD-IA family hydrolase [Nocardiopsis changdeensis]QYX36576.1 HAD-IA family hydrolase [Nocardiopsis sp. MT53]
MDTDRETGLPLDRVRAVVLDTDGVITDTASVHAAAWKRVFDAFLVQRARDESARFRPFDLRDDYLRYVDGRSRADGARAFLASRGVHLPQEPVPGHPETVTVALLTDRKDRHFQALVTRYGVRAFPGTVQFVKALRSAGVPAAAVSASLNCAKVLRAAHVEDLFDVRVDGVDAVRLGLPGKPDPALFLEAVRRLGAAPTRSAVVEDALAGVEAGRRGGFGLIIGVDRTGMRAEMSQHGAHVVVTDLAELLPVHRMRSH